MRKGAQMIIPVRVKFDLRGDVWFKVFLGGKAFLEAGFRRRRC